MPPTLLKPARWNWSPSQLAARNRNNARGLILLAPLWDRHRSVNLIDGSLSGAHVGGSIQPTVTGSAWSQTNGTASYVPFDSLLIPTGDFSALAVIRRYVDGQGNSRFITQTDTANDWSLRVDAAEWQINLGGTQRSIPFCDPGSDATEFPPGGSPIVVWLTHKSGQQYASSQLLWTGTRPASSSYNPRSQTFSGNYGGNADGLRLGTATTFQVNTGEMSLFAVWNRRLSIDEMLNVAADPFGLIRKELWTPDLAPAGGASGSGDFAVSHTHSVAFTASEGEASSFAVSHTHSVAFTASEGEASSFAVSHTHSVAFTASGDTSGSFAVTHTHSVAFSVVQSSLRATLAAALSTEATALGLTPVAVVDHPRSPIPGVPCLMVAPGSPWLQNAGPSGYEVRLDVAVYAARADVADAWDTLERWQSVVRNAAPEAEMRHESTTVGVEASAGVEYVVARSTLVGNTRNP